MVSKSWGRAISGPVLAFVGLVLLVCQLTVHDSMTAELVLKIGSWITLGIAALMIYVAQYEVWKAEHELRIEKENELNRKADMRGVIAVEVGSTNSAQDHSLPGGFVRYNCECANHGMASCQITQIWVKIVSPGDHMLAIPTKIEPQNIDHGKVFRHIHALAIRELSADQLRGSNIMVSLVDSMGHHHMGTKTVMSNRIASGGPDHDQDISDTEGP
jgi:hypothetical protein